MSHIAVRFDVPLSALLRANDMTMTSKIRPGQKIVIPGRSSSGGRGAISSSSGTSSFAAERARSHEAKARATGSLTYDEQLALVHTLGHLENGACVVNHLLTGILPVPVELLLKSRLQGNPASCQRIRARTAALRGGGAEFGCACRFGRADRGGSCG